jgi:hypothetical protein
VKNTRVLSQTKKTILSTSKQNKTNQTRPDQQPPKKENPRKKETTHFRLSHLTTNFHHSTTYSNDDITHTNNATEWPDPNN